MSFVDAVAAVGPATIDSAVLPGVQASPSPSMSFSSVLMAGIEQVDQTIGQADRLVAAYALDDSIPIHQVTYALEQARLSMELMLQVRTQLLESYQELMRMQL